jgi:cytoskeleton-associated protein 5
VYPASKLFLHVMKGLESKNSRTRTECLDEIASLLQRNGLNVFNPSKSLPLIATQVSDRDSSVRNASLGAICQAYLKLGDDIYKYLGRLSDKDKGIITERIRRLPAGNAKIAHVEPEPETFVKTALIDARKKLTLSEPLIREPAVKVAQPNSDIDVQSVRKEFTLDFESEPVASKTAWAPAAAAKKPLSRPPSRGDRIITGEMLSEERIELLIDSIISTIGRSPDDDLLDALKQLEKAIGSYPEYVKDRSQDIVMSLTNRSRQAFSMLISQSGSQLRTCIFLLNAGKHLQNVLVLIFSSQEIASSVPSSTLEMCIREILFRLVDPEFLKAEGGSGLTRALNVLMVRVIENANANSTFRALMRILSESTAEDQTNLKSEALAVNNKYLELSMKCLWKITKVVGSLITTRKLVVEELLFDIHEFLQIASPQYWKQKATETKNEQADMPLRTVKTILHEIVNNLGVEAMHYAAVLPNQTQNHVVNYLRQMVLNYEKKNQATRENASPTAAKPQVKESAESQDFTQQLDSIFGMISDKELTKQGIQRLHEFQKLNPSAFILIESRLAQTGSYFQGYIRRGLATLAQSELAVAPRVEERRFDSPSKPVESDADSYKETLARLQRMFVGKESKTVN